MSSITRLPLPILESRTNHFLISSDGSELIRFCDVGDCQMMITRFALEAGQWEPQGGGFNWTGIMRQRYQSYIKKGYRKYVVK